MRTIAAILISDLGGTEPAHRYAESIARTASSNGNMKLAAEYLGAMVAIERINPALVPDVQNSSCPQCGEESATLDDGTRLLCYRCTMDKERRADMKAIYGGPEL